MKICCSVCVHKCGTPWTNQILFLKSLSYNWLQLVKTQVHKAFYSTNLVILSLRLCSWKLMTNDFSCFSCLSGMLWEWGVLVTRLCQLSEKNLNPIQSQNNMLSLQFLRGSLPNWNSTFICERFWIYCVMQSHIDLLSTVKAIAWAMMMGNVTSSNSRTAVGVMGITTFFRSNFTKMINFLWNFLSCMRMWICGPGVYCMLQKFPRLATVIVVVQM
jgi:hypothetical protein